jgi:hypothetical protein
MLKNDRNPLIARKRARATQTAITLLKMELLETQLIKRMPAAVEAEILAVELIERLRTAR